jgi:hypothetical protein
LLIQKGRHPVNSDVRCPTCPVDTESTRAYEVVGQRGGRDLYVCSVCGTKFQEGSRKSGALLETFEPITSAELPSKARDSVIRVSEGGTESSVRRRPVKNVANQRSLRGAKSEATASEPNSINLHSDVGWVYPAPPDKYHFDWEPPDLGQEPPSRWRRKWNETVNMFKYFRLVNDSVPPPLERAPAQVYRGVEELRELKPTEPDAV